MEFFSFVALSGFLLICGLGTGAITARATKDCERGRGAWTVAGFFAPTLFAVYLLLASHLREEFHRQHSEAYCSDPNCTVPLGHDFTISYFDDMPSMAAISRGSQVLLPSYNPREYVRGVAILSERIYVETSNSDLAADPPTGFFAVDLILGDLKKFKSEPELRVNAPSFGQFETPDEVFRAVAQRQRTGWYWPCIVVAPYTLLAGVAFILRRIRSKTPA